jgi:hypothetical protein
MKTFRKIEIASALIENASLPGSCEAEAEPLHALAAAISEPGAAIGCRRGEIAHG